MITNTPYFKKYIKIPYGGLHHFPQTQIFPLPTLHTIQSNDLFIPLLNY